MTNLASLSRQASASDQLNLFAHFLPPTPSTPWRSDWPARRWRSTFGNSSSGGASSVMASPCGPFLCVAKLAASPGARARQASTRKRVGGCQAHPQDNPSTLQFGRRVGQDLHGGQCSPEIRRSPTQEHGMIHQKTAAKSTRRARASDRDAQARQRRGCCSRTARHVQ